MTAPKSAVLTLADELEAWGQDHRACIDGAGELAAEYHDGAGDAFLIAARAIRKAAAKDAAGWAADAEWLETLALCTSIEAEDQGAAEGIRRWPDEDAARLRAIAGRLRALEGSDQ